MTISPACHPRPSAMLFVCINVKWRRRARNKLYPATLSAVKCPEERREGNTSKTPNGSLRNPHYHTRVDPKNYDTGDITASSLDSSHGKPRHGGRLACRRKHTKSSTFSIAPSVSNKKWVAEVDEAIFNRSGAPSPSDTSKSSKGKTVPPRESIMEPTVEVIFSAINKIDSNSTYEPSKVSS